MLIHSFIFVVILSVSFSSNSLVGDRVYTLTPINRKQLMLLKKLEDANSVENGLDFWNQPSHVGDQVKIHVPSDLLNEFIEFSHRNGFREAVFINNLARTVAMEAKENLENQYQLHKSYMKHSQINQFLESAATSCGSRCSLQSIGKSYEGRDMKIIKIGNNPGKPDVWIDGGIHAREWISPATVVYIIDQLVNSYNKDSNVRFMCDNYNFHILPVHNPDGYDYTHTSSSRRYWRKTRSSGRSCRGVDANRNFGYKFGGQGTSSNSCSDIYRGPSAFSEKETAAVRDYVTSIKHNTKVFLTVHSYGQYFLIPYGYQRNIYPPNYNDMLAAANVAANEIKKHNGRSFTVGHSANLLYPAAGASDDWARSIGIPYSYCVELPDTGRYGFNLPSSWIEPVGKETLAGFKALLDYIRNK